MRATPVATRVFAWIGLYEPTEEEFAAVAAEFDLHELAVEDGHKVSHQRPKLELYDDTMFVVLKTARYVDSEEVVEFGEIALYISRAFVVAVRRGPATALAGVRRRIEDRPDLLALGPGAVLYGIVDKVVDDYMPVMDGLDNDIQEVEKEVFQSSRRRRQPCGAHLLPEAGSARVRPGGSSPARAARPTGQGPVRAAPRGSALLLPRCRRSSDPWLSKSTSTATF